MMTRRWACFRFGDEREKKNNIKIDREQDQKKAGIRRLKATYENDWREAGSLEKRSQYVLSSTSIELMTVRRRDKKNNNNQKLKKISIFGPSRSKLIIFHSFVFATTNTKTQRTSVYAWLSYTFRSVPCSISTTCIGLIILYTDHDVLTVTIIPHARNVRVACGLWKENKTT